MPLYPAQPSADQPTVQARRTSTFTLGGAFADIDLDTTDVQNYLPVLEKTAADNITAKVTGNYEITFGCTGPAAAVTTSLRVRKNDTTVLPGSEAAATSAADAEDISRQFVASLAAGDFVTLQAMASAGAPAIAAGITFTITHLAGQKGDTGAASATDIDAVHVNVAAEISGIANKATPDGNDLLIIEDSVAGYAKKRLLVGALPSGAPLSDVNPLNVSRAAADPGVAGESSRVDHHHDVDTAIPEDLAVGNTNSEGADSSLSRSKHRHGVPKGTPVSVGTAAAAGASGTFSDGEHVHPGLTRGAGDFAVFGAKVAAAAADLLLIEDSADAGAKKQLAVSGLPPDSTAIHKAVAGEIAAIPLKAIPVSADLLVIEDSADANAKKSVSVGSLPSSAFGANFQYSSSEGNSSTTSAAWSTKVSLTTPALSGTYRVGVYIEMSVGTNNKDVDVRLYNSTDATELCYDRTRFISSGQFRSRYMMANVSFVGAAKTFQAQYASPDGLTNITVRRARIEFWREQ